MGESASRTHASGSRAAHVFVVCWAITLLYDVAVRWMVRDVATVAVSGAALAVLLRPSSGPRLALLLLAQLGLVASRLPGRLLVHWTFEALIGAILLLGLASAWRRGVGHSSAEAVRTVARPLRLFAACALLLAGVAKLNTSFLDVNRSCASALVAFQIEVLPGSLRDGLLLRRLAIAGTLLCEIGGPVLLLTRRFRPVGAILVTSILFGIGINPGNELFEFTAAIGTPLLLFASVGTLEFIADTVARGATAVRTVLVPQRLRRLTPWLLLLALAGLGWLGDTHEWRPWRRQLLRVTWDLGVPLLAVLLIAKRRGRQSAAADSGALLQGRPPRVAWALLAAFLLWEMQPYVGRVQRPNFTMASGFESSGEATNHLTTPPSRRLGPSWCGHWNEVWATYGRDTVLVPGLPERQTPRDVARWGVNKRTSRRGVQPSQGR